MSAKLNVIKKWMCDGNAALHQLALRAEFRDDGSVSNFSASPPKFSTRRLADPNKIRRTVAQIVDSGGGVWRADGF